MHTIHTPTHTHTHTPRSPNKLWLSPSCLSMILGWIDPMRDVKSHTCFVNNRIVFQLDRLKWQMNEQDTQTYTHTHAQARSQPASLFWWAESTIWRGMQILLLDSPNCSVSPISARPNYNLLVCFSTFEQNAFAVHSIAANLQFGLCLYTATINTPFYNPFLYSLLRL